MSKTRSYIKSLTAFFLFFGIMLSTGCGVFTDVTVSADKSVNLSQYKTFAWIPDQRDTNNSPYNNEIIRSNLKNYFGQNFACRGYTMKSSSPDLLLQLVVTNKQQQKQVVQSPHPSEYYFTPYYFKSRYYSPYPNDYYYEDAPLECYSNGVCVQQMDYVEGSITLNVIDRKLNKLVWSGSAKGDIYDPAHIDKDIHPAVKRIMKEFPLQELNNKTKTSDKEVVLNSKQK